MSLSRRMFMRGLAAFGASSTLLSRALAQSGTTGKALVTIFLRGGVDGLSMVPALGDPQLQSLRPTLFVKGLPLNGFFGLHPAMSALLPLYHSKKLAVLHATGQASASRSHFEAQDFLESGDAGKKHDGFLNRAALAMGPQGDSAFRVVALQNALPRSLSGEAGAVAFPSLKDFRVAGGGANANTFESLYDQAVDDALRTSGQDAFAGMDLIHDKGLGDAPSRNGASYPRSVLGKRLQDIARLIHGEVGLRIAATETGGFDTHLAQGADEGQLATRLKDLGDSLAAFATDLGTKLDDVVVLTVTEFGRTARENGTRGTDHGTASAMFAMGGGVRGGRVIADWPGLAQTRLFENRDLAMTTDVRCVLVEALSAASLPSNVFPDFTARRVELF